MSSSQPAIISPLTGPDYQLIYAKTAENHYPTTFGVESEFALAYLHPPVDGESLPEDPDPEDPRDAFLVTFRDLSLDDDGREVKEMEQVQCHIRDTIVNHLDDLRSVAHASQEDMECRDEQRLFDGPGEMHVEDMWLVNQDLSVNMPRGQDHYAWKGMEIITPALYLSESMLVHVQSVVSKLLSTYRINTNDTTSMHVHVGFCKRGYELQELENLLVIWWTFEPLFFSLVEPHRRKNKYCHYARHATSLAAKLRLKRVQDEAQTQAGLDMILGTKSVQELAALWQTDSRGLNPEVLNVGVEAKHLFIQPRHTAEGKNTVEFRLHEGCLEPEEVRHWVKLCCGLVAFATMVDANRLTPWIGECRGRELRVLDLLRAMRMSEQADWFEVKLQRMEAETVGESG